MGKKSSTTTQVTTLVHTNVVKLTYLQTLAASQNLVDVQDLNTEGYDTGQVAAGSSQSGLVRGSVGEALIGIPLWGLGKSSSSVTEQYKSSGVKIKDSWMQPYFDTISYKIGIKELNVSRYTFAEASEFTSVVFGSPKEIVKASLVVDEYVPAQFDVSKVWIHYFIKVEGEETWVRVNPMNKPTVFDDSGLIVPRILNYNLPKPTSAQIEDKYQYTDSPVKQVRLRAVLYRPTGAGDEASMTPLLKSYRIAMQPRE